MAAEQSTINGYAPSWASIGIDIGGLKVFGVKNVDFSEKLENGMVYGLNQQDGALGQTEGVYKVEGTKLTVYSLTAKQLREELAKLSPSGKSYGFGVFTITILFRDRATDSVTHEIRITGCKLIENSGSWSQSPDALEETMAFSALRVYRDGLTLGGS